MNLPDNWPQSGGGPGRDSGSLGLPGLGSSDLPGRLVKPRLDAVLPILLEVGILNDVVMLRSHSFFLYPSLLFQFKILICNKR